MWVVSFCAREKKKRRKVFLRLQEQIGRMDGRPRKVGRRDHRAN